MLTASVACPTPPPINLSPPPDETPITTAFGTPVGNAVTQTLDASHKVVANFTFSDLPVCLYGIANLSDHVEFNLKPAGADFTIEAIQNQTSKSENFRGQIRARS